MMKAPHLQDPAKQPNTASTIWHEPGPPNDSPPPAGWASLLNALELSLQSAQAALLTRSVAEIEERTHEQEDLMREFKIRRRRHPIPDPATLRPALNRIAHLGRVQLALLARAQQDLRIASNLLAGPHTIYGPPSATDFSVRKAERDSVEKENPACRA